MMAESAQRRYSVLGGTVLTLGMRWCDRLIAVASMIILARLLTPEHFGIIAIAALAIGLADVLVDLGVNVALVRNADATQAHYDTAWTLRLAQMTAATLGLVLAAPFAADYFNDPRVAPVLQVMAFTLVISGLENIGIVSYQKHMQFGAEFRFLFLRRMALFLITIALAWILRSYWALVIGVLVGRAAGVALSYALHPMRPRFSLEKFRDIFAVSQWLLLHNIGFYLHGNLHKIVVGRWSGTATMGAYSVASDIALIPSGELLAPLNRVLFPAFAEVQRNVEELGRIYMRAQAVQTLIAVPAAAGLTLVANEAVWVLLGEQWLVAVPFVQVLALVSIAQALTTSGNHVLIVVGRVRSLALLSWTQVSLFLACAYLLLPQQDALQVAWLRLLVAGAGIWLAFWLLMRALPILKWREILRASMRPLSGAAAMTAVLLSLAFPAEAPVAVALFAKVATGASVYVATVLGIWWAAGRPDGAESYLLTKIPVATFFTRVVRRTLRARGAAR